MTLRKIKKKIRPIEIDFTEQKGDSENNENAIFFK